MNDDIRHRALRGMLTVGLRTVVVRLLGFAGTLVLARLLTPEDYGILALGMTVVVLSKFLSDGGLAPSLIRRQEPPRRDELGAVLGVQLGISALAFAGMTAAAIGFGGGGDHALTFMAFACVPLLDAPRTPTVITVERELDFGIVIRGEIAEILVYNVLAVGLVAAGLGVVGTGVAAALKSVVGTTLIVSRGSVGVPRPRLSWRTLRPLLGFGIMFQAAWIVTLLRDEGLNLVLAGLGGTAALGAWALARRILIFLTLLVETAWRVALPGMARLLESGMDPGTLLSRSLSLGAIASGLPVVFLVGTTPALVPALFGDGWEATQEVLPLVAGGLLLAVPLGLALNSLFWARDEAARALKMGMPPVVVMFATATPLVPRYGALGAGIGWLAASVTFVASAAWFARELFGAVALTALLVPACAAAAGAVSGWTIASVVHPAGLAVAASTAAGLTTFAAALLIFDRESVARCASLARQARLRVAVAG